MDVRDQFELGLRNARREKDTMDISVLLRTWWPQTNEELEYAPCGMACIQCDSISQ